MPSASSSRSRTTSSTSDASQSSDATLSQTHRPLVLVLQKCISSLSALEPHIEDFKEHVYTLLSRPNPPQGVERIPKGAPIVLNKMLGLIGDLEGVLKGLVDGLEGKENGKRAGVELGKRAIDDEVAGAYFLEMNHSINNFHQTILTKQANWPDERKLRICRHFGEVLLTWTIWFGPDEDEESVTAAIPVPPPPKPVLGYRIGGLKKVFSLSRRSGSSSSAASASERPISTLESKFVQLASPTPIRPAYPSSPVSALYSLRSFMHWVTPLDSFCAISEAIGPCRMIYLVRLNNTLEKHEYLVFGFGADTPTSWMRVDRIGTIGRDPKPLKEEADPAEFVCFASSKEALIPPDSEEIASIRVDLAKHERMIRIPDATKYLHAGLTEFPATTLWAECITFWARYSFSSLAYLMTRADGEDDTTVMFGRSTILNWGDLTDTRLAVIMHACRNHTSKPHFSLDDFSKVLAMAESTLHRSFLRESSDVFHENDMIKRLEGALTSLDHVLKHGPPHMKKDVGSMVWWVHSVIGQRYALLSDLEPCMDNTWRVDDFAIERSDEHAHITDVPLSAMRREAVLSSLLSINALSVVLMRMGKNGEVPTMIDPSRQLVRIISHDGSPSSPWTPILASLDTMSIRARIRIEPTSATFTLEQAISESKACDAMMRAAYNTLPTMAHANALVAQLLGTGTILYDANLFSDAFMQADITNGIMKKNQPRFPYHFETMVASFSCQARWAVVMGKFAECLSACQQLLVILNCVPGPMRPGLVKTHFPLLQCLLIRRRTYDVLNHFGMRWPLAIWARTTKLARDYWVLDPVRHAFLLADCLTSQAWAHYNKRPFDKRPPIDYEREAITLFDSYRGAQHPRAEFQAVRSLAMLSLYYAADDRYAVAEDCVRRLLARISLGMERMVRMAILSQVLPWVNDHANFLLYHGSMEDGAWLKSVAVRLLATLRDTAIANDEETRPYDMELRRPDRAKDERSGIPDDLRHHFPPSAFKPYVPEPERPEPDPITLTYPPPPPSPIPRFAKHRVSAVLEADEEVDEDSLQTILEELDPELAFRPPPTGMSVQGQRPAARRPIEELRGVELEARLVEGFTRELGLDSEEEAEADDDDAEERSSDSQSDDHQPVAGPSNSSRS